jgi:hypothetical protein
VTTAASSAGSSLQPLAQPAGGVQLTINDTADRHDERLGEYFRRKACRGRGDREGVRSGQPPAGHSTALMNRAGGFERRHLRFRPAPFAAT